MPKLYWKNCWQYKRILEILEDYWLSESEEYKVRVRLDFIHTNGSTQSKDIWWKNPNYTDDSLHAPEIESYEELMKKTPAEIWEEQEKEFWEVSNIHREEN